MVLGNRLEAVVLIAKVVEVRVRQARPRALGVDFENGHNPVRLGIRQRPQQHAIYNAEDGRGSADGQCERKDHDRGGPGVFAELSSAVATIGEHGMEPQSKPCFADLFFHLLYLPVQGARHVALPRRHACANILMGQHCEGGTNLLVEVFLKPALGK